MTDYKNNYYVQEVFDKINYIRAELNSIKRMYRKGRFIHDNADEPQNFVLSKLNGCISLLEDI